MTLLSFVIPCYRSEKTIKKVIDEIITTVSQKSGYDYEVIAVNDGSPDGVYGVLQELALHTPKIKVINLAKNMGKHAAVMAGYAYVNGEYIVNLDDDYQSPVDHLWELVAPVEADLCDVATAEYAEKKEARWKKIGSNFNMLITEIMLDKPKGLRMENLNVVKRFVVDEVIRYKNPYPFVEGLILGVTKRVITVPMEQRDRGDDKGTGFTFFKSLALFSNGLTNFSVKPLRIAMIAGLMFSILGFLYGVYIIINRFIHPELAAGWSSLMAVMLFSSGIIMLLLGVIGEYLGRIYISLNRSPQYVIRETINTDDDTP